MNTGRSVALFVRQHALHCWASVVRADPAPEGKMICCHVLDRVRIAARKAWRGAWVRSASSLRLIERCGVCKQSP
jgi:hypothetical protein